MRQYSIIPSLIVSQYLLMQSQKMPAKTKAIEKSKKDKRLLRKKLEEEEEKRQENDEDEDSEDDIEDSEEETESEIITPQSLTNNQQNTPLELQNSSQTESIQRSSVESSEMMVQGPTDSNSKQVDKENNTPSFYIGQDQIEQSPQAKSSSSSSSDSSQSSSEADLDIGDGDDDIMGFVGGQFEEDEFYDIDDDSDDDEFDIETDFDMESERLRASIEEARIKAMMEKSLPNPFSAQNIINEMVKMVKINQVNHKYLSDLKEQKAKQPSTKKLFFDEIITIKTFKKQQQPHEVMEKLQKFEGLNSNQKNPTQRVMAQQRLWHQLKNNPNAHALFDQHLRESVKIHNAGQVRFPINLGPLNRNYSGHPKKPNMILRSQLRPVQKPVEIKPMSITDVVQSQAIGLISDKQANNPTKNHSFVLPQGSNETHTSFGGEADIITHVNAMQQEMRPNMSDQMEKPQNQIPISLANSSEFNVEDENFKVGVVCESFQQNIIDKVLVDS